MTTDNHLEQAVTKRYLKKDKRRTKKMPVSGKSVFRLKATIDKKATKRH